MPDRDDPTAQDLHTIRRADDYPSEERVEVVEKRHNHAANVSHSACPACLEDGARRKKGLGDLQMWLQMRDGRIPVTIGNAISTLRFWTWKLGGGRL